MNSKGTGRRVRAGAALALALLALNRPAYGYIRVSYSLGRIATESTCITVVSLAEVDRMRNLLTFRKVRDIRGLFPADTIRHNIGKNGEFSYQGNGQSGTFIGESARDWRDIMEWANVGKEAVLFWNGGPCEVCIGNYWYQVVREGNDWRMLHAEPTFALAFAGRVQNLILALQAMQAGQEAVVSAMVPSDIKLLLERTARLHRLKASLKLIDYNPQRDFVSWGGDSDQLRPLTSMPGFSHYGALSPMGVGVVGVASACFNGDGKPDLCLFSEQQVVLMENREGFLAEIALDHPGGARAAAWADYNGDNRPDLLLATPSGLRLLANTGGGTFTNRTAGLPPTPYPHLTAAAWIRRAPDARPDILLADGFRGLRLYRNLTGPAPAAAPSPTNTPPDFEDVSDTAGLGTGGIAGTLTGDTLCVADVNGDGLEDALFSAGTGVLLLQTPRGFAPAADSGIAYRAGGVRPAFGDCNGDGRPDLFVPQPAGPSRLFINEGAGRFRDVTAQAGALARPIRGATCAVWSDFCKRGRPDLLVGCLNGQNRYLRNTGKHVFADAGGDIGLYEGIYNTTGISVIDVNQDGVPDLVMGNSGAESAVLLGSRRRLDVAEAAGANTPARRAEPAVKGSDVRTASVRR